jgi:uncharacterized protein YndB with AHSA1/START domain
MTDSQRSTRVDLHIRAPRARVYQLLLDAEALANWRVPDGMAAQVHELDAREGGAIRVSLTYLEPSAQGKTAAHTDTYHGRFVRLVPNERVVELDQFETSDPALRGEMTSTITLARCFSNSALSRPTKFKPCSQQSSQSRSFLIRICNGIAWSNPCKYRFRKNVPTLRRKRKS